MRGGPPHLALALCVVGRCARRTPPVRASLVEVIPPKTFPASASDARLERLLGKVAAAEAVDPSDDIWTLHRNLQLAGFELMDECDAALATRMQPTALERLSVRTSTRSLDPAIASEALAWESTRRQLLYDGRVLLWRRGYGSEQSEGWLILAKLDYLQEALVQRVAIRPASAVAQQVQTLGRRAIDALVRSIPTGASDPAATDAAEAAAAEATASDDDDAAAAACEMPTTIERSSIGDAFDGVGPLSFLAVLLGVSAVSEPTYGELVVAWRRAPPPAATQLPAKARVGIPAIIDAVDENRDGQISLEEITSAVLKPWRLTEAARQAVAEKVADPPPPALELRLFKDIPIANYEITIPNSKPEFALADWLRLDLVSLPALLAVLSSYRFDGEFTAVDIAAASAVVVWLVRTIFNYRNTLFRYELLLNRFLTEKLSIRDGGEVRAYAAREARSEQARVAAALLAKLREHGQPMSEESLVRALVGEAARVEFGPALRELKRLGLVRESIVAKRPRGAGAEDDAERRTEDGRPSRAVGEEQGSAPEAARLEMDDEHQDVLVEAAPDGDEALSRHWQGLLGV